MPVQENPVKCETCDNHLVIHGDGLKIGMINSLFVTGGPGQVPTRMGNQWAIYYCPACRSVWPFKRYYSGSRQLQDEFTALHAACAEWNSNQQDMGEIHKQVEAMLTANKTLSSLPGGDLSIETLLEKMVKPLQDQVATLTAEVKRRRGGRPRKNKDKENEDGTTS